MYRGQWSRGPPARLPAPSCSWPLAPSCPRASYTATSTATVTDTSQLSKYPALQNLEKQTNVPKTYTVIGVITLYFFFIVFNLGGQLLTNLAGFAIPGYYSLNALFTASKSDDTQWLTVSCTSKRRPPQPPGPT